MGVRDSLYSLEIRDNLMTSKQLIAAGQLIIKYAKSEIAGNPIRIESRYYNSDFWHPVNPPLLNWNLGMFYYRENQIQELPLDKETAKYLKGMILERECCHELKVLKVMEQGLIVSIKYWRKSKGENRHYRAYEDLVEYKVKGTDKFLIRKVIK